MERRTFLSGLGGLGGLSLANGVTAAEWNTGDDTGFHPGPPKFIDVNQTIETPLIEGNEGEDRDNLAPRIPDPEVDPDNYAAEAFTWSVADAPDASSGDVLFYQSYDEYDSGTENVAEFDPDVPGTYTLELDAPEETHELTVRVFDAPPEGSGGPPRVSLADSWYDKHRDEFVVEADAKLAPDSTAGELDVEFYADDRDALSSVDISVDGYTARVPAEAVEDSARVHAVAVGDVHSVADTVELEAGWKPSITHLSDRPDWAKDGVFYQIFVQSYGGEPGATDFGFLTDKVQYLDWLGVDAVWLTPILQAHSFQSESPPGGPHGYDIVDYFQTAESLRENGDFETFVDTCHAHGIRVVFDLVAAHTAREHPFFQDALEKGTESKYYDWYKRRADGSPDATRGLTVIPKLNHENVAAREFMLSVVEHWASLVDGFRCDLAWGVPHSFWREVRDRVKRDNPDFLLWDEALPADIDMGGPEFDLHYDSNLHGAFHAAGGNAPAERILDAVEERERRGFNDHDLWAQYIENHDTFRYRDYFSRDAMKAATAATFTLPGTPIIYYGQERGITEYGQDRPDNIDEYDDILGSSRDFMPWDEYDEELLSFTRSLVHARKTIPTLRQDADIDSVYYESDSQDVVAFTREWHGRTTVVVLNFGDGATQVDLPATTVPVDLLSRGRIGVETDDESVQTVEVDSVAIVAAWATPDYGTFLAGWTDDTGDDYGPGSYTYPTADAFYDGAWDAQTVGVYETADSYRFAVEFAGNLQNPFGLERGFSHQFLQMYIRDPERSDGDTTARYGVNAELAKPYHYRLAVNGQEEKQLEKPDGTVITFEGVGAWADAEDDTIVAEVPKSYFEKPITELELAVLVCPFDGFGDGNLRDVQATNGPYTIGGGSDEPTDPRVMDILTPRGVDQSDALAPDGAIPYLEW